jgi:UDP-sugar transporter A1/2/3
MNEFTKLLYDECVVNRIDFMKLTIPSILYTVQNTLQYYSISLLSAPVFQVLSQLKILTTAIFSVLLLSRKLSVIQWTSIVFLSGRTSFTYLLTYVLTYSFIRWCIISPIIPIK